MKFECKKNLNLTFVTFFKKNQMNIFQRFWKWLLSLFFSKNISITIIGLPSAGKTTLVRAMSNEDTESVVPTIGVLHSTVKVGGLTFDISDIAGNKNAQVLWEEYCNGSNLILYVIDSADQEAVAASEQQLESLFANENISSIPILVIANKQDLPEALNPDDIMDKLKLQNVNDRKIKLFCTSAKLKTHVSDIIQWICDEF